MGTIVVCPRRLLPQIVKLDEFRLNQSNHTHSSRPIKTHVLIIYEQIPHLPYLCEATDPYGCGKNSFRTASNLWRTVSSLLRSISCQCLWEQDIWQVPEEPCPDHTRNRVTSDLNIVRLVSCNVKRLTDSPHQARWWWCRHVMQHWRHLPDNRHHTYRQRRPWIWQHVNTSKDRNPWSSQGPNATLPWFGSVRDPAKVNRGIPPADIRVVGPDRK